MQTRNRLSSISKGLKRIKSGGVAGTETCPVICGGVVLVTEEGCGDNSRRVIQEVHVRRRILVIGMKETGFVRRMFN